MKIHPVPAGLAPDSKHLMIFCAGLVVAGATALAISTHGIGLPLFDWMFGLHYFSDWVTLYIYAPVLPNRSAPQLYSPPVIALLRAAQYFMSEPASEDCLYFLPIAALLIALWRLTKNLWAPILVAVSYPCLFGVARGNMEVQAFLLVFTALACHFRGKSGWFFALIFLSSLIKPFTLLFLLIAWRDHPKRVAAIAAASTCANIFLLYLLSAPQFYAFVNYVHVAGNYEIIMALDGGGDLFNNSFSMLGKILLGTNNRLILYGSMLSSLLLVAISCLYAVGFPRDIRQGIGRAVFKAPELATLFFLPLVICFCIPVSADYRLSYFLISAYFLGTEGRLYFGARTRAVLLILYFAIIVPKHFVVFGLSGGFLQFPALPPVQEMTIQSILNPLLMLCLCGVLAYGAAAKSAGVEPGLQN